jgi:hypothetical protein
MNNQSPLLDPDDDDNNGTNTIKDLPLSFTKYIVKYVKEAVQYINDTKKDKFVHLRDHERAHYDVRTTWNWMLEGCVRLNHGKKIHEFVRKYLYKNLYSLSLERNKPDYIKQYLQNNIDSEYTRLVYKYRQEREQRLEREENETWLDAVREVTANELLFICVVILFFSSSIYGCFTFISKFV